MKKLLIFIGGFVAGILATLLFAYVSTSNNMEENNGVVYFEQPGDMITENSLEVIQVLDKGVALAREYEGEYSIGGLVVLLMEEGAYFYDDQIVELDNNQCFKQIGVYTYMTNRGTESTVPIVQALDK